MAALLRRRLTALAAVLALLALPGPLAASGQDAINEALTTGRITGTYTCAELDFALRNAPSDSGAYDQIVAAIQQAQAETIDPATGKSCAALSEDSGGGLSGGLVLGIAAAAILAAAGSAVALQRRSRRQQDDV